MFFTLLVMETGWTGWDDTIFRKLIPAGIGNLIGGTLLMAVPSWYAFKQLSHTWPPSTYPTRDPVS